MIRDRPHVDRKALLAQAERDDPPPIHLASHLARCATCREVLESSRRVILGLRGGPLAEPAVAALERVSAMFPRRPALPARVSETVARLVAGTGLQLTFAAGVRGPLDAPARLQFAGAGLDVALEIAAERAGLRVTGQVLPGPGGELPFLVWAESGGERGRPAPVEPDGVFVIDAAPPAAFDLVLDAGERRVRLPVAAPTPEPRE